MKFEEYLSQNMNHEWRSFYIEYGVLKRMIEKLVEAHVANPQIEKGTSLTIPRPTNAAGMPVPVASSHLTQEQFFKYLEQEMKKIEEFTKQEVQKLRNILAEIIADAGNKNKTGHLTEQLEKAGELFLQLEKYVNLNFTGFHKILKKHDKLLPNPCKSFYLSRLHNQSWVRGEYSDIIVSMSKAYSLLRGDETTDEKPTTTDNQNFIRQTRKFWINTRDISSVKYTILQHTPVILQEQNNNKTDAQLVNSVYLDNHSMELYRGRLDKIPGAIALRIRWYGSGVPTLVYIERECWVGEVSIKDRFKVNENQVMSLLNGTFDIENEIEKLRQQGNKTEQILQAKKELMTEVIQAINSKQLVPTLRTQYMRTSFQTPFDESVRLSLDTNVIMINERIKQNKQQNRWYRDPSIPVPYTEITRFPHGILDIKLDDPKRIPKWLMALMDSGKIKEIHRYSKFIYGCSVLLSEDIHAVPSWIDDKSLIESIRASSTMNTRLLSYDTVDPNNKQIPSDPLSYHQQRQRLDSDHQLQQQQIAAGSYQSNVGEDLIMSYQKSSNIRKLTPIRSSDNDILKNSILNSNGDYNNHGDVITTNGHGRKLLKSPSLPRREIKAITPTKQDRNKNKKFQFNIINPLRVTDETEIDHEMMDDISRSRHHYDSSDGGGGILAKIHDTIVSWYDYCFSWAKDSQANHMTVQKVEPKLFFANERTFMSWLRMSVMMTTLSLAILAFTPNHSEAQFYGFILMPVAFLLVVYAMNTYIKRCDKIRTRDHNRWDDPMGPILLTSMIILALTIQFIYTLIDALTGKKV